MPTARLFLFLALAALLGACDSATGPLVDLEAPSSGREAADDSAFDSGEALRRLAVCHLVEPGTYRRTLVAMPYVADHLQHGDELAGGTVLDAACEPVAVAPSCACFAASDLGQPLGEAAPAPYVFFDVFNYYAEDARRTEVRSTLSTDDGLLEEVAAVYITSTGNAAAPLAPLCFRQDAVLDETGGAAYAYTTRALDIDEAEACRLEIGAFADGQEPCQGGACDLPYTEEQLDPDYPPYHDGGYRTPDPLREALRARIEAVRERLTLAS